MASNPFDIFDDPATNPFDAFDQEPPPAAAHTPSLPQRFGIAAREAFHSNPMAAVARGLDYLRTRAVSPIPIIGDMARARYEHDLAMRREARANYDAMPSFTEEQGLGRQLAAGAASLAGAIAGSAVDPTNWLAPGRSALGRIAGGAAVNAGGDAVSQGIDVGLGGIDDFSVEQLVMSAAAGAGIISGQELFRALRGKIAARRRVDAVDAMPDADIEDALATGDPEAMALLRAAGMPDEDITRLSTTMQRRVADRLARRRMEEIRRRQDPAWGLDPQRAAHLSDMDSLGGGPTLTREALRPLDEQAPRPETTWIGTSDGQVMIGRDVRPGEPAAPAPPPPEAAVAAAVTERYGVEQALAGAGGQRAQNMLRAHQASAFDAAAAQRRRRAGAMPNELDRTLDELERLAEAEANAATIVDLERRASVEAMLGRRRHRLEKRVRELQAQGDFSGEGQRDLRAGGRPQGGVESQRRVLIADGQPVQIVKRGKKGRVTVAPYDPRTGAVTGKAFTTNEAKLKEASYALNPRMAQEFEDAARAPVINRGAAAGRRADDALGLPRQTFRVRPPERPDGTIIPPGRAKPADDPPADDPPAGPFPPPERGERVYPQEPRQAKERPRDRAADRWTAENIAPDAMRAPGALPPPGPPRRLTPPDPMRPADMGEALRARGPHSQAAALAREWQGAPRPEVLPPARATEPQAGPEPALARQEPPMPDPERVADARTRLWPVEHTGVGRNRSHALLRAADATLLAGDPDYIGTTNFMVRRDVDEAFAATHAKLLEGTKAQFAEWPSGSVQAVMARARPQDHSPLRIVGGWKSKAGDTRPAQAIGALPNGDLVAIPDAALAFARENGLAVRARLTGEDHAAAYYTLWRDDDVVAVGAATMMPPEDAAAFRVAAQESGAMATAAELAPSAGQRAKADGTVRFADGRRPRRPSALLKKLPREANAASRADLDAPVKVFRAEDFGYQGPVDKKVKKSAAAAEAKDRADRQFAAAEDFAARSEREFLQKKGEGDQAIKDWIKARDAEIKKGYKQYTHQTAEMRSEYYLGFIDGTEGKAPQAASSYAAQGAKDGKAWVKANPKPPSSKDYRFPREAIRIETRTATGRKTIYDMPAHEYSVATTRNNIAGLHQSTFYSNPIGPALSMVGDALRWAGGRLVNASPDAREIATMAREIVQTMRGNSGPNAARRFWSAVRKSDRGHMRWIAAQYKSATLDSVLDKFDPEPGTARGAGQVFDEAVEEHVNTRSERWHSLVAEARATGFKDDEIVDMMTGARPTPSEARAAVKALETFFREEHKYVTEAGVKFGKQPHFFPRVFDTEKVRQSAGEFVRRAGALYRNEKGWDAATAKEAAENLRDAIVLGDVPSPLGALSGGSIEASTFKAREFGPAADRILRDFYVRDLDAVGQQYITSVARRAEVARRMGDNFSEWDNIVRGLRADLGEQAPIVERELAGYIANETGIGLWSTDNALARISSAVRFWTTLSFLEKAFIASAFEPFASGIRAGRVLDGLVSFGHTYRLLAKRLAGKPDQLRELAEDIGVIGGIHSSSLMTHRLSAGDVLGRRKTQVLSHYFRITGLDQLTKDSRVAAMRAGMVFIRRLARDLEQDGGRAKAAKYFLAELGIAPEQAADVGRWVRGHGDALPDHAAVMSDDAAAKAYRAALLRFADQSIQRPSAGARPRWASHPLGAMIFQLNGFAWSFGRNILVRQANLAKAAAKGELPPSIAAQQMIAGVLPALMAMSAGAYFLGEARDEAWSVFDNHPAHERMTTGAKVERAISRTGILSGYDQFYQLLTGLKYEPSIAKQMSGPGIGAVASGIEAVLQQAFHNNPHSNAAERKLAGAFYDFMVEPALNAAIAAGAPGPVKSALTVGAIPNLRPLFVEGVAGEKKPRKDQIKGLVESMLERQSAPQGADQGRRKPPRHAPPAR